MKQGWGRRLAAIGGAFVVLLWMMRPAAADNVSKLIDDLASDDYKVRLSSVASLAKLGDERAIEPLVDTLTNDSEKSVRGAAAVALGKIVTSDTDPDLAEEALDGLTEASKSKDSFTKKRAKKALAKVKKAVEGAEDEGGGGGGGGGIYVNLGPMSATIDDDADTFRALMKKTVEKTFNKEAPNMPTKWKGGTKEPSKKDLKGTQAFYVDGTLNDVSAKVKGGNSTVTCKVHMLIASFPDKSIFGFLDGKASVGASDDPADIAGAKKDCVAAVVEDLTIKKIIPTIKAKAGP